MTELTVSFGSVSVPSGTSGTVTVYEDVGADGSGSNTDPNGKPYNNSDSFSLSDGVTSYTTGDVFDGSSGNEFWLEIELDNTDVTKTAEVSTSWEIAA